MSFDKVRGQLQLLWQARPQGERLPHEEVSRAARKAAARSRTRHTGREARAAATFHSRKICFD